jgi:hypothetical protein
MMGGIVHRIEFSPPSNRYTQNYIERNEERTGELWQALGARGSSDSIQNGIRSNHSTLAGSDCGRAFARLWHGRAASVCAK